MSLFDELSDAARAAVVAASTPLTVSAGDWLFRQGEAASSMFVIRSGRLEVVREQPDRAPEVVRVLREGAALGELALLTGSSRSASVRAKRDTSLWELDALRFAELLRDDPVLGSALTRVLARLLQGDREPAGPAAAAHPVVLALVPVSPELPATAVLHRLTASLQRLVGHGRVLVLDEETALRDAAVDSAAAPLLLEERHGVPGHLDAAFGRMLDRAERSAELVLLAAGTGLHAADVRASLWTDFCLRQADRVLALVPARTAPDPASPAVRRVRDGAPRALLDLCVVGAVPAGPSGTVAAWLDVLPCRAHHLLATGPSAVAEQTSDRLARRLTGRSTGLVLSGGGARGMAHIGVLAGLAEAGIVVDRVGGCSFGAFVGALHAAGRSSAEIATFLRSELVDRRPLNDYVVPRGSLISGRKFRALLHRAFGECRIEDLQVDFFAVSANLDTTELMTHRQGLLWRAVAASMSIPGMVPPFADEGPLLVDGGVLNNLPVDVMAATGEGPVVAVDVMDRRWGQQTVSGGSSGRRAVLRTRGRAGTRPYDPPSSRPLPGIVDVISRAAMLGSWQAAEQNRVLAEMVVTPDCRATTTFDWTHLDALVDAGRRAVDVALEDLPQDSPLLALDGSAAPGR